MKYLVFWTFNESEITTTLEDVYNITSDEYGITFLNNNHEALFYVSHGKICTFFKE